MALPPPASVAKIASESTTAKPAGTATGMPYFSPAEVSAHNCEEDLWLSFLGNVYNITPLIKAHKGSSLVKPLLAAAGTDVSHWFDAATGEVGEEGQGSCRA